MVTLAYVSLVSVRIAILLIILMAGIVASGVVMAHRAPTKKGKWFICISHGLIFLFLLLMATS